MKYEREGAEMKGEVGVLWKFRRKNSMKTTQVSLPHEVYNPEEVSPAYLQLNDKQLLHEFLQVLHHFL